MTSVPKTIIKLLIFARYPNPGQAKTRLIPALRPDQAALLYRRLSERVLGAARQFQAENDASGGIATTIRVCFTGSDSRSFRAWLGNDLEYQRQAEGDLGRRLTQALELAFQHRLAHQSCDGQECGIPLKDRKTGEETEMALVLGTDLRDLTPALLHQAVAELRDHDLVLGPAQDGGYYLLGLKKPRPQLFCEIAWGSARVREQTLAAATRLGLSCGLLPTLADIDRPEDLAGLTQEPDFGEIFDQPPLLSVIIPTLNEAVHLEQTLAQILSRGQPVPAPAPTTCKYRGCSLPQAPGPKPGPVAPGAMNRPDPGPPTDPPVAAFEIIVTDGGSQDETRQIAARAGAVVLNLSGSRAARLNAGAAKARGTMLFFLHADSLPPPAYPELIRRTLTDPTTVAGVFSFRPDRESLALRLIARGVALRSRLLRLPYGDQGLFLEKRVFNELGGFAPLPIMEDFELVRRLGKRGRIAVLPEPVISSARRWQQQGVLRTWLINQLMVLGFLLGIAPERLARFYRRGRGST